MNKNYKEGKTRRAGNRKVRRASGKAQMPATEVTVTFRHVEPTYAMRSTPSGNSRTLASCSSGCAWLT